MTKFENLCNVVINESILKSQCPSISLNGVKQMGFLSSRETIERDHKKYHIGLIYMSNYKLHLQKTIQYGFSEKNEEFIKCC